MSPHPKTSRSLLFAIAAPDAIGGLRRSPIFLESTWQFLRICFQTCSALRRSSCLPLLSRAHCSDWDQPEEIQSSSDSPSPSGEKSWSDCCRPELRNIALIGVDVTKKRLGQDCAAAISLDLLSCSGCDSQAGIDLRQYR